MGTMIQALEYDEAAFRGERFKDFHRDLRGNNDLLILTQPQAIEDIHADYLRAGADIVATNTFSSTSIAQADYDLSGLAYELNLEGAKTRARNAAARVSAEDGKPRFVAGAIGPTNRTASISPDVSNPGFRAVTFDDLRAGLWRADQRPARRRRRSAAGRNHLRHAERQGGALRHRGDRRGARHRRAGDDLRHHHRQIRPPAVGPIARRRSGIRCVTPGPSPSALTARSAPKICAPTSPISAASPIRWSAPIRMPACPMNSASTTRARNTWRA